MRLQDRGGMLALVGKSLCEGNGWLQTTHDQRVTCHFATPGRLRQWRRLTEHAPEKKPSPGRPDRPVRQLRPPLPG